MSAAPDEIGVGDRVSQEEIEDIFNTDFGYYVKGINPRRDENDSRYILLFANEDGPYGDSVTEGQFEYIGEGLEGDQSETSPGNSTLIDSVTENIPVYFFYKKQNRDGWEYQGQVNVFDYRREKQDGRQIFVFTHPSFNALRQPLRSTASGESFPSLVCEQLAMLQYHDSIRPVRDIQERSTEKR